MRERTPWQFSSGKGKEWRTLLMMEQGGIENGDGKINRAVVALSEEAQSRTKGEQNGGGGLKWKGWEAKINWSHISQLELSQKSIWELRLMPGLGVEQALTVACGWFWYWLEGVLAKTRSKHCERSPRSKQSLWRKIFCPWAHLNFRQKLTVKISYDTTTSFHLFRIPLQVFFPSAWGLWVRSPYAISTYIISLWFSWSITANTFWVIDYDPVCCNYFIPMIILWF